MTYDFRKDNGLLVTVDFEYSPGSETTYSPMYGANGGDGCEVSITSVWPKSADYDRLLKLSLDLGSDLTRASVLFRPFYLIARAMVEIPIWLLERQARLTDAERERMEEWITENHEYEPPDEEDYY